MPADPSPTVILQRAAAVRRRREGQPVEARHDGAVVPADQAQGVVAELVGRVATVLVRQSVIAPKAGRVLGEVRAELHQAHADAAERLDRASRR